MIRARLMVALLVLSVSACAVSYIAGRAHQSVIQARKNTKLELAAFKRAEMLSRELAQKEKALETQRVKLEEAANADPVVNDHCLSAARVRRLNLR